MKPMKLGLSLVYFSIPALIFIAGFWLIMPWFSRLGILPFYAYLLGLDIPLILLLIASLVWFKAEGRELTWQNLRERFRLKRMDGKAWLWSLGALIVGSVIGYGAVSQLSSWLIAQGLLPVPASIPAFMSPSTAPNTFSIYDAATGGLRGNWLPAIALTFSLVLNILGEEFWWRGVVLPRQELAFGKWTWLLHGTLWACFHIFKWWDVLYLLPVTLSLAFVCSKLKNTTPGIVIHSITNGISLIPVVLGIIGVIK